MAYQTYPKYIAVTGPIASGKTTLGSKIAEELGYTFIPEEFEDNPHLAKYNAGEGGFYEAEMWFLERDFRRHQRAQNILQQGGGVVLDKPIYQNFAYIDTAPLTPEERAECVAILQEQSATLTKPGLIIDISADPDLLIARIAERGREIEKPIQRDRFVQFAESHKNSLSLWPDTRRLCIVAGSRDYLNDIEAVREVLDLTRDRDEKDTLDLKDK
ncbi:AAA family ATPase [Candidatus Dojkabacteria bacterium]|nr:AAA family ATPase [Candidatus Dojkabacteria bacterium]